MKSKSIMGLFLFISLLMLVGCQSSSSITQTPAPTKALSTNTPEPTFTQTHTPIPTATKQPTPTFTSTPSTTSPDVLFLSDMRPYNGPVNVLGDLTRDRVFWQDKIWINGVYYPKGLGMHAPETGIGYVSYKVPAGYSKFISLVGLAREDGNPGCESVGDTRFRAFVNDVLKFNSGVMVFGQPVSLQISIKEGDVLRLEVDNSGDDYDCDHSTWAEARFEP